MLPYGSSLWRKIWKCARKNKRVCAHASHVKEKSWLSPPGARVPKLWIECFHMTSRRPYWCPKTIKRRPCWCPKPILWELNSFLMQTFSFVPINFHKCWPREWKHSIKRISLRLLLSCSGRPALITATCMSSSWWSIPTKWAGTGRATFFLMTSKRCSRKRSPSPQPVSPM